MQKFTGWQYLLIDAANQMGHDKARFEERIQWTEDHLDRLEELAPEAPAKTRPLYLKAVQAIRKAQRGEPTGHRVGFDAVCSGMQIMSALTGCEKGSDATGLVDPNRRADAYTQCVEEMRKYVPGLPDNERKRTKVAVMTVLYGSKAEPKKAFGEDTPELEAFYKGMYDMAPGACELLDDLLNSWQPFAEAHAWQLPDGFDARVKVMQKVETRIEVDELDHASFTYQYYVNEGCQYDRKNAANVVHSVDAYVLRTLVRRCSYDPAVVLPVDALLQAELVQRALTGEFHPDAPATSAMAARLIQRYAATRMADVRILPYLDELTVQALSPEHIRQLLRITSRMLEHRPFSILTVHDEFTCHPNHMNHLRQHYIDIMADLAESTVLDDILSTLHGVQGTFPKKSTTLGEKIRQSNYALC